MRFLILTLVSIVLFTPAVNAQREDSRPQLYKSRSFQVFTDLPKEEAEELVDRLETMLVFVSRYWGKPCRKMIKMFVVKDFQNWTSEDMQNMAPEGIASIRSDGGLTMTSVRGIVGGPKLDANAVVYATADHGTPQHEAVHAYCGLTFGELGPVWYAEGMAEVGQYWRKGERGVTTNPYVLDYLKSQTPKPLNDIVNNPLETTGDSWQNYAWRWTLCHLLGFNENYTQRFKPLGMSFLAGNNTSFDTVYGNQFEEIDFEYKQFLQDVEPGYRCDLCSWDWKTRFRPVSGKAQVVSNVEADRGWQASRLLVTKGESYSITTTGDWSLSEDGDDLTADGDENGNGRLVGVLFQDYELSEVIELGTDSTFRALQDGKLYLRCRDDWGKLDDNKGDVKVSIKLATP